MEGNYLEPSSTLTCRNVSKLWLESIDGHYRDANIHSVTFGGRNRYHYPIAAVLFPLDETFAEKLKEYSVHGKNPFVGNRLLLVAGGEGTRRLPEAEMTSMIQNPQMEHVWKFVQHLEIEHSLPSAEFDPAKVQPFLEKMSNVKSVLLDVTYGGVDVLRYLPHPEKLDQIVFVQQFPSCWDQWQILDLCHSHLKLLCNITKRGLGMANELAKLQFDELEELNLKNGCLEALRLVKNPGLTFPSLKVMHIAFDYDCGFFAWLTEFTQAVSTLELLQVFCTGVAGLVVPSLPVERCSGVKCARAKNLRKVIITGGGLAKPFKIIVERLRLLFSGVSSVTVHTTMKLEPVDVLWSYEYDGDDYRM